MSMSIKQAIEYFTRAIEARPDWVEPMDKLAWFLATHRNEKIYNPQKAIQLAERTCELTGYKQPMLMDTLAIAYAAAGKFDEAITTAENAFELALSSGHQQIVRHLRWRLMSLKAQRSAQHNR